MWHGWILMEIPCHFSSQLDLVAVWSKSTSNFMTIPCNLSRFYLFSMLEHDMDFGYGQVMEFPWHLLRKWWDFPCGFGLIFWPNQTAVKRTWENPRHIFYRGVKKGGMGNIPGNISKLFWSWKANGNDFVFLPLIEWWEINKYGKC